MCIFALSVSHSTCQSPPNNTVDSHLILCESRRQDKVVHCLKWNINHLLIRGPLCAHMTNSVLRMVNPRACSFLPEFRITREDISFIKYIITLKIQTMVNTQESKRYCSRAAQIISVIKEPDVVVQQHNTGLTTQRHPSLSHHVIVHMMNETHWAA